MQDTILQKVEECFLIAEKFFNRVFPRPTNIIFKRNGTKAGTCLVSFNQSIRELMFQLDLAEHNKQTFHEIVVHEMAHYIQRMVFGSFVKSHGKEWKYVMIKVFNAEPIRCHSYDTSVTKTKRQNTYEYTCDCSRIIRVKTTSHNRIQNSLKYQGNRSKPSYYQFCKCCRSMIRLVENKNNSIENKLNSLKNKLKQLEQQTVS